MLENRTVYAVSGEDTIVSLRYSCQGRIQGGERRAPFLNSAKIGLYTGRVCLKNPNEWHCVMSGKYRRAFSATDVNVNVVNRTFT